MENTGEQFLHRKDSKLHTSRFVEHEKRKKKKAGEEVSQKPADKIVDWLKTVEKIHTSHQEDPTVTERIKRYYHKENVIKPKDIPESAFLLEQRIAREEGWGKVEITNEFKEQKTQQIITNQEESLDKWINYLSSKDATYPTWAKYWAFTSVLQMGKLEKVEKEENGEQIEFVRFSKRTEDTVAPFPILNVRALAMSVGVMRLKLEQKKLPKKERIPVENLSIKLGDADFQQLLSTESFSKLYAQFLLEIPEYSTEGLQETRGEWMKYGKGSDPQVLVDSLEGYPLEWCTADISTARGHLQGGDFYVYYSINEAGEAVIPRLAIRIQDTKIAEVRGIAFDQNLDPYIGDVLKRKLQDFPDGEAYKKRSADMKRLTGIDRKRELEQELTTEDLRFLYEIDSKIDGFGYGRDPRIEEIIGGRDIKTDLSLITGYSRDQISTTRDEALRGGIKFHYDNLHLSSLQSAEGLELPETINGDLYLSSLQSTEGLGLPETMNGGLYLHSLQSAEGLELPETINGNLDLSGLQSAEGLSLPKTMNGDLDLYSLQSAEGLSLPETMNGNLYLSGLQSAEGLSLPKTMNGDLYLYSLQLAEGLSLPKTMNGVLDLSGLQSAEGLKLPKTVNGNLYLSSLRLTEGLNLPEKHEGIIYFDDLPADELAKLKEKYPQLKIESEKVLLVE